MAASSTTSDDPIPPIPKAASTSLSPTAIRLPRRSAIRRAQSIIGCTDFTLVAAQAAWTKHQRKSEGFAFVIPVRRSRSELDFSPGVSPT